VIVSCPSNRYPVVAASALLALVVLWIVAFSVALPALVVATAVQANTARGSFFEQDAISTVSPVLPVDQSIPRDPALDYRCRADAPTCVPFLGCAAETEWRCESRGVAEDGSGMVRFGMLIVRIPDVEEVHRYLDDDPDPGLVLLRWGGPYVVVESSWSAL